MITMNNWQEMIEAMQSGQPFECDEETWNHWLDVLPPVYMNRVQIVNGKPVRCSFGFAEGPDYVVDFWMQNGKFFGCKSNRIATATECR